MNFNSTRKPTCMLMIFGTSLGKPHMEVKYVSCVSICIDTYIEHLIIHSFTNNRNPSGSLLAMTT